MAIHAIWDINTNNIVSVACSSPSHNRDGTLSPRLFKCLNISVISAIFYSFAIYQLSTIAHLSYTHQICSYSRSLLLHPVVKHRQCIYSHIHRKRARSGEGADPRLRLFLLASCQLSWLSCKRSSSNLLVVAQNFINCK